MSSWLSLAGEGMPEFIAAGKQTGCLGRSVTRFQSLTTAAMVHRGELLNGMLATHLVSLKFTT